MLNIHVGGVFNAAQFAKLLPAHINDLIWDFGNLEERHVKLGLTVYIWA